MVVPSPEGNVRAAGLWLGPAAVLSGTGAAWWWGMLPEPPVRWHFVVAMHRPLEPGLRIIQGFVDPLDRTELRGVAVVSRPLAVLRAGTWLEADRPGRGIALVDRAKQQRWVGAPELELAFRRNRGTRGTRAMRMLLERTGDRAHSALERMGVGLLHDAGITGFVLNYRTILRCSGRPVEFDIAFPDRRVAVVVGKASSAPSGKLWAINHRHGG